ncbi:MAG: copper homeostasis protein CutC [Pedobacter sp.]
MVYMEVCANSLISAIEAEKGGAVRVELCDNLLEGGTTPSYAQIKLAKERLKIEVYPIIRPRGGDFLYSDLEFDIMCEDIQECKKLGCDGVVIGILKEDGSVDMERCMKLVALAKPMKVTFHRAFDMTNDLFTALEDIIALGFDRILTSGGMATAYDGIEIIKQLVVQAGNRITIMAGAGIALSNIAEITQSTGIREFHGSARQVYQSNMAFRNKSISMGGDADEYSYSLTDSAIVKNLIDLANSSRKILSLRH